MKTHLIRLLSILVIVVSPSAIAVTRYVNLNNPSPASPYASWATAATNIQDAIDAANAGDQVIASNGVYQAGSRVSADGATNRVVVTKPVGLLSLNGAAVTVITGSGSMRCVYLTNGAVLSGFTLTSGNAVNGAGVYCASTNAQLLDCQVTGNSGKFGGGVYSGTLSNCIVSSNSVVFSGSGGGTYNSTLFNCTITGNSTTVNGGSGAGALGGFLANCLISNNTCNGSGATVGGGASGAVLTNCILSGNRVTGAGSAGGGANASTLISCTVTNNRADHSAGGVYNSVSTNCTIVANRASYGGGGVSGGTLVNCVLRNNTSSGGYGGGVYWTTTLINCTLVGNSAGYGGGGYSCTFYNCIIYYNSAPNGANTYGSTSSYSCTTDAGTGNTAAAPVFVNQAGGDFRLQAGSGGIDVGTNSYAASLTDLDGNLRIANGTVDMGAYEYQQPNPASVSIECNYIDVVVGIPASFKGIFSRGKTISWDFGDGTIISNQVFVTHAWSTPGDYPVTLTTYDDSNPGGVSGVYVIHVIVPPISYVDPGSLNPVAPFSSWETAATNIQDAVDAVIYGAHILVTNGIYQSGGRKVYGALTNRLVVNKPVVVQSVNGPTMTTILGNPVIGDSAVRCVYLTNNATLVGFTLLNGATRNAGDGHKEQSGGGVWCESTNAVIFNCLIISNSANALGGGIRGGSLTNCSVIANAATGSGGGAYLSVMSGCLVSNNTAVIGYGGISGGGASSCTLVSCTVVSNITDTPNFHPASGGGAVDSTLVDCTVTGNSGKEGGGAYNSKLRNCTLYANSASSGTGGAENSVVTSSLIASNWSTGYGGGGVGGCTVSNCVITGNSGYGGGGANGGTLVNSLITSNAGMSSTGGGAYNAALTNCTVFGNWAYYRGGGVDTCTVWNSIIVSNSVVNSQDYWEWYGGLLSFSCTAPLPETGAGNITNAPLFVNQSAGNFQLQTNSPCINAGTNGPASATDLAGNPRIIAGTIDLGTYENQNPALLSYFLWMQSFGLPTTSSAASMDSDGDGANNYNEWRADTTPTNALSAFRIVGVTNSAAVASVTWQSVPTRNYWLERATNLSALAPFQTVATNIAGVAGNKTLTDTTATNKVPYFYRVGVY